MHSQSSKRCPECGQTLPLTEFLLKTGAAHGYCRPCRNAVAKAWRLDNQERRNATKRASYHRNRETNLAKNRAWREANRARFLEGMRRWRAANPEREATYAARRRERRPEKTPPVRLTEEERRIRRAARAAVLYEVRKGRITRLPCERCGSEPAQAHHHRGYAPAYWFDVRWLCSACHWTLHPKEEWKV